MEGIRSSRRLLKKDSASGEDLASSEEEGLSVIKEDVSRPSALPRSSSSSIREEA